MPQLVYQSKPYPNNPMPGWTTEQVQAANRLDVQYARLSEIKVEVSGMSPAFENDYNTVVNPQSAIGGVTNSNGPMTFTEP